MISIFPYSISVGQFTTGTFGVWELHCKENILSTNLCAAKEVRFQNAIFAPTGNYVKPNFTPVFQDAFEFLNSASKFSAPNMVIAMLQITQ